MRPLPVVPFSKLKFLTVTKFGALNTTAVELVTEPAELVTST